MSDLNLAHRLNDFDYSSVELVNCVCAIAERSHCVVRAVQLSVPENCPPSYEHIDQALESVLCDIEDIKRVVIAYHSKMREQQNAGQ